MPADAALEIVGSRAHGHVQVISVAMQRLGMASLLGSTASPERDRVLAMIAAPNTKLATTAGGTPPRWRWRRWRSARRTMARLCIASMAELATIVRNTCHRA